MLVKHIFIWGAIPFAICLIPNINYTTEQSENAAPEVKIIKPLDKSVFHWNSLVPYSISVSDKEDGNSVYDEINNQEVLMEIRFFSDSSALAKYSMDNSKSTRNLLREMSRHNCLNCHAARNKLIGPSFDLIAQRYANQENQIDLLTIKLIQGSTGVWGEKKMPPQPDLTLVKAREMVKWILEFETDVNYSFSVGTEGSFKSKEKKENFGAYILTASYQDQGLNDTPRSSKEGQQTIVLVSK